MTQDREHLREWIRAEAHGRDWLSLWPAFAKSRAELLLRMTDFSEEQARWRPAHGKGEAGWTAFELATHVLAYSGNVSRIIEATSVGRTEAKDPPGTTADHPQRTFADLVHQVIDASIGISSLPERLPAEPNLETTVDHAFFGPLNCREWYVFLRVHDTDHLRQLERLRDQAG